MAAVLLLILATAFFVASEYAFVTVDRGRIERGAESGDRKAQAVQRILQRLSINLSGTQLGTTVTSLLVGFIAEPTVASALEPAVGHGPSIVLGLVLVTALSMVIGELIPKNLAIARPERLAKAVARPVVLYSALLGPVIRLLYRIANATVRRIGIEPAEELTSVRSLEELELLIRSSGREGVLDPEALDLLTRTLRFTEKTAADALVPRLQTSAVAPDDRIKDLIERSVTTGFSRFPVCRNDLDDIVGVVHVKDVYRIPIEQRAESSVAEVMSEAFVVPESRDLGSLLLDLRGGLHFAVVVDEYGGTAGIITIEDVLEEIVGEIDDEYDAATPKLTRVLPIGTYELPASLHPDEVLDACGFEVPEGEYETLAGFVLDQLGRIPAPGDRFDYGGWSIEVTAMDRRRVDTVRLTAPVEDHAVNPALVVVGLVLVLANGVFVAMEFALVASRRTKLQTLAADGDTRARFALEAASDLSLQLAGTQLGVTMASLLLGAVAEPTISEGIEKLVGLFGSVPDGVVSVLGVLIGLGIVVSLHLIFGEMVPKYVALADPERALLRLAILNRVYFAVFRPIIRVLSGLAHACLRVIRVEPRDELVTAHTAEEISMMVTESREEGLIAQSAHDLLSGALDFGERRLNEVMVPFDEVVTVSRQDTVSEAEARVIDSGHSRLLVTGRDQDEIVGFVHAKDLLTVAPDARDRPLPLARIRRVLALDASRALDEVLVAMRRTRTHVAAVLDEDRHVVGLATLEDVLEDLVGDIVDESDADNRPRLRPRRRTTR